MVNSGEWREDIKIRYVNIFVQFKMSFLLGNFLLLYFLAVHNDDEDDNNKKHTMHDEHIVEAL